MGNIQFDGKRAIMDVRERVLKGEHPRQEIMQFVKTAPVGMIFEIHLPHRGEPLIAGLESLGMNVIVNELEPMHFRLMAVKLNDF
ncbi:MAG TPA: amino acid decarboxylase [Bacillales bacterium]|nr:amino acid decarboxylase [Bacillales bacterium]